jgi:hypothetical protein
MIAADIAVLLAGIVVSAAYLLRVSITIRRVKEREAVVTDRQ